MSGEHLTPGARSVLLCQLDGRHSGDATIGDSRMPAATVWSMLEGGATPEDVQRSYPHVAVEHAQVLQRLQRDLARRNEEWQGGEDLCESAPPAVDRDTNAFLEENEKLGEALTEVGMLLGLARPTPGSTWGAREVIERAHALVDMPPEPEVVSGAEAWRLPDGSIIALEERLGDPFSSGPRVRVRSLATGWSHWDGPLPASEYRVLYRGTGTPPLAVGDPIETAADLERLPVGAVVRTHLTVVAERVTEVDWLIPGVAHGSRSSDLSLPAHVLYLP